MSVGVLVMIVVGSLLVVVSLPNLRVSGVGREEGLVL
jgi:hypothetical protein